MTDRDLPQAPADYTARFVREFARHIPDIDLKTALYLADVGHEDQHGDAVEEARSEAEEWKLAS